MTYVTAIKKYILAYVKLTYYVHTVQTVRMHVHYVFQVLMLYDLLLVFLFSYTL